MTIWTPKLEMENSAIPKYKALANAIYDAIQKGDLKPGDKLPTHRRLADELKVTVGTITRGYAEAERRSLLESKVGSGTYVKSGNIKSTSDFVISEIIESDVLDLNYSIALSQNQEQLLADELSQIANDSLLMKKLISYQPEAGMQHHRESVLQWMNLTGIKEPELEQTLVTNGGQHGFFASTMAICRPGDTVLSAGLTYPGFNSVARQLKLRHIGLEMDEFGVTPSALRVACQRFSPRMIYLTTRLNNPSCEVMNQKRIDDLADILREYQVWAVEDDVQGCLQTSDTPCFFNSHDDITVFITSTSKALAGGLRVGSIAAPKKLVEAISHIIKSSCWMAAPLMVEVASRWINGGQAQTMILNQRQELKHRHGIVKEQLAFAHMQSTDTAFNVWLKLPEPRQSQEFVDALARKKVLVKPSQSFAAGQFPAPAAVRFCIGGELSREQLKSSLSIIRSELDATDFNFDFTH